MGIFSKQKICPICNNNNEIKLELVGSRKGAMFVIVAKCNKCDYHFYFDLLTIFIFFIEIILVIPLIIISYEILYIIINGNYIFALVPLLIIAILIPEILLIFFIRSSIFNNYIDKLIMKKAEKMINKGLKKDFWGNSYKNQVFFNSPLK